METFQYISDRPLRRQDDGRVQVVVDALHLYSTVLWRARLHRWWSVLTGHPYSLLALNRAEATGTLRGSYSVGICAVPIHQIRGSEGRSDDFDAHFHPCQERTRGRWLSIATACLMGVTMPPVELLQVRDVYYVRDGHHRISVARAMGQEYIEAEVMVWEPGAQPLCARPEAFCLPTPRASDRLRNLGSRRAWQAPLLLGLAALFTLIWFTIGQPSIWLRLLFDVVLLALLWWVARTTRQPGGVQRV